MRHSARPLTRLHVLVEELGAGSRLHAIRVVNGVADTSAVCGFEAGTREHRPWMTTPGSERCLRCSELVV